MNKLKIYNDASLFDLDKNSNFEYPSVARIKNPKKVEYALDYDTSKYKRKYFTIKAEEDEVNVCIAIKGYGQVHQGYFCSYDNGKTWETIFAAGETHTQWTSNTLNTGDALLLKGYDLKTGEYCDSDQAVSDGRGYPMNICTNYNKQFSVYGNIQSLHCGDNFIEELGTETTGAFGSYEYKGLFYNARGLISAKNLILQYPTLAFYGYSYMFQGCTLLTEVPKLPATELTNCCYESMFYGCTALIKAPELPATTVEYRCYNSMFRDCTSLTEAPELPATTLEYECYDSMFRDCTSLAKAPELPATTLEYGCYNSMFYGCTSLTEAPELPATTLKLYCYSEMFYDCNNLIVAPELPATTLVSNCYYAMFYNCHKLNYIKAMFTTTPSSTYTAIWVEGVASTGTFVKNSGATWTNRGTNAVPNSWTIQTASS